MARKAGLYGLQVADAKGADRVGIRADRLRMARVELRLSQPELSARISTFKGKPLVSQQTIAAIEARQAPSARIEARRLRALARALDVDPEWLAGETDTTGEMPVRTAAELRESRLMSALIPCLLRQGLDKPETVEAMLAIGALMQVFAWEGTWLRGLEPLGGSGAHELQRLQEDEQRLEARLGQRIDDFRLRDIGSMEEIRSDSTVLKEIRGLIARHPFQVRWDAIRGHMNEALILILQPWIAAESGVTFDVDHVYHVIAALSHRRAKKIGTGREKRRPSARPK